MYSTIKGSKLPVHETTWIDLRDYAMWKQPTEEDALTRDFVSTALTE